MNLFSQILSKAKTDWTSIATTLEDWGSALIRSGKSSAVAGQIVSGLKQSASDAVTTADTAAGPLLAEAATVLEGLFDQAATAYVGPVVEKMAAPIVHDGFLKIASTLKAVIDAQEAAWLAKLAPAPTPAAAPPAAAPAPAAASDAAKPWTPPASDPAAELELA